MAYPIDLCSALPQVKNDPSKVREILECVTEAINAAYYAGLHDGQKGVRA